MSVNHVTYRPIVLYVLFAGLRTRLPPVALQTEQINAARSQLLVRALPGRGYHGWIQVPSSLDCIACNDNASELAYEHNFRQPCFGSI